MCGRESTSALRRGGGGADGLVSGVSLGRPGVGGRDPPRPPRSAGSGAVGPSGRCPRSGPPAGGSRGVRVEGSFAPRPSSPRPAAATTAPQAPPHSRAPCARPHPTGALPPQNRGPTRPVPTRGWARTSHRGRPQRPPTRALSPKMCAGGAAGPTHLTPTGRATCAAEVPGASSPPGPTRGGNRGVKIQLPPKSLPGRVSGSTAVPPFAGPPLDKPHHPRQGPHTPGAFGGPVQAVLWQTPLEWQFAAIPADFRA